MFVSFTRNTKVPLVDQKLFISIFNYAHFVQLHVFSFSVPSCYVCCDFCVGVNIYISRCSCRLVSTRWVTLVEKELHILPEHLYLRDPLPSSSPLNALAVIPMHCNLLICVSYVPYNDIVFSQSADGIYFT